MQDAVHFIHRLLVTRSARGFNATALIAFIPPIAWYAQWIYRYGGEFFWRSSMYMNEEVYGSLSPACPRERRWSALMKHSSMSDWARSGIAR